MVIIIVRDIIYVEVNKLKEINLNGKARIKLNEKGLKRFEELIDQTVNNDMVSAYSKKIVIRETRKCVDEEGYLTDSLNSIMGDYDVSCFDSLEFSMQDINTHEWFNLNLSDEVTVQLNGIGVRRTLRKVLEIERDASLSDEEKKSMIEKIESGIDDDNNLTATLGHIISNYAISCLVNQVAKMPELTVTRGLK